MCVELCCSGVCCSRGGRKLVIVVVVSSCVSLGGCNTEEWRTGWGGEWRFVNDIVDGELGDPN